MKRKQIKEKENMKRKIKIAEITNLFGETQTTVDAHWHSYDGVITVGGCTFSFAQSVQDAQNTIQYLYPNIRWDVVFFS